MTVVDSEYTRPLWPRVVGGSFHGWLWHELEICDGFAAMTHRGSDAIRTGVSSTNDNHVLSFCSDPVILFPLRLELSFLCQQKLLLVCGKKFHCEINTLQFPSRNRQVAGFGGTQCQAERIKICIQLVDVDVFTDIGVGHEFDSLVAEEVDSAVDGLLLEFHVGDSVHEQTSDAVGAFKHGDLVAHLVQLVGTGQSGRTRSNDGNRHAGSFLGNTRGNLSVSEGSVYDRIFNVFDGHGVVDESGHAGSLAGCGAHSSCEFWEVICAVQALNGLVPVVLEDQVVPFWNQVVDRASGVGLAEGCSAIHTTGRLNLSFEGGVSYVDISVWDWVNFFPIL
mmetsp:Transcript_7761/g.16106  ORF Transcript_7761/g.16106 Transcript_7761/m.16106 type:complete len:336 (-) Transcript_7761:268-1275(-)